MRKAIKSTVWYDRHVRSWVVQALDDNNCQVGNSIYVYSKREALLAEKTIIDEVNE